MNRRQTRLRREFLYKKSLETKEKLVGERKQKLKEAVESKTRDSMDSLSHF